MTTLPEPLHAHSTVTAIFKWYEEQEAKNPPRPYLGASIIGKPCDRSLWYQFRHVKVIRFEGRMLRLFDTGHREEHRFVEELQGIGCEVLDRDPATGEQFEIKEVFGHFSGHADSVARGMPEGPKTYALVEYKTHSAKSFADLVKKGVEKAKPEHFVQMQIYMRGLELTRAIYLARNKDTDDLHCEWIHYDKAVADEYIERAERIIFAGTPPEGISTDPAYWQCKFCDYQGICHQDAAPRKGCRTCVKATPCKEGNDGAWKCERWGELIPFDVQLEGCDEHLFIPNLLTYAEPIDAGDNWIEYKHKKTGEHFLNAGRSAIEDADFRNQATLYSSDELSKATAGAVTHPFVEEVKELFPGAEIIGAK